MQVTPLNRPASSAVPPLPLLPVAALGLTLSPVAVGRANDYIVDMLVVAGSALVFAAAFVGMEAFAWVVHRHLMHGRWGWGLHASHHRERTGAWEANDLFAVAFAAPAIALFVLSRRPGCRWAFFAGAGATAYGVVYALVHDGLTHRRWPIGWRPKRGYVKRLVQAHRLHHAVRTRDGGVSFGFLYAPDPRRLRSRLKTQAPS